MKSNIAFVAIALAVTQPALAQDGVHFGAGVTAVHSSSRPDAPWGGYEPSGTDAGLALTLGYRFASSGPMTYGVEGNLDLLSGNTMDDACISTGPTWCEINTMLRLRGTSSFATGAGGQMTLSLGAVLVKGVAEDGPGFFVDATGTGMSLGVAWEPQSATMPLRYDLNYDRILEDDTDNYERSMDVIGLRVSYMF